MPWMYLLWGGAYIVAMIFTGVLACLMDRELEDDLGPLVMMMIFWPVFLPLELALLLAALVRSWAGTRSDAGAAAGKESS